MELFYGVRAELETCLPEGLTTHQSVQAAVFALGIPPRNLKYLCKVINGDANLPYQTV